jgi:lipoprotein signal peptidase
LAVLAVISLIADIATKTWAEKHLDGFPGIVNVWKDHVAFVLAKNKGGAWGLLQGTS